MPMSVKMASPDLTSYISSTMSYLEEKVAVGNSKLTDVSISCLINDGDLASYSFNASILAYQSPFLKDALNSIATTDRYHIILPDVKMTTLRQLRDLLYSGRCILDSNNPCGDMKEVLQLAKSLRLEIIVHGVKLFNEIKEPDLKSWEIRNDEVTVTEDLDLVDEDTMGMGVDTAGNPLLTGDDCNLANPGVHHEEVNNNHEIITDDSARIEEIMPASVNHDDQSSTTNMMTVTTANSLTDQEVKEFVYANDEFTQICSSLQMPSNDSNLEDTVPPVAVVPPIKLQPPVAAVASVQRKPRSEMWVSGAKSNKKPNKRRGRSSTLVLGKETAVTETPEVPGKIKTEVAPVAGDMLSVPNASKCPLCKGSITGSASLTWELKYQHHLALRHYKHSLLHQYGTPDYRCYICDASFYGEEAKYVLHLGVHHNLIENLEDKKVIEPLAVENFITEIEPNVIVLPERKESEAFHGFEPEDVDQPVIIEPEERHVHRYNTRGGRSRTEKAATEEDTKPASQPSKKRKHCCEHCGLKASSAQTLHYHLYAIHFKADCITAVQACLDQYGGLCPLCLNMSWPEWRKGMTTEIMRHFATKHKIAIELTNNKGVLLEENVRKILSKITGEK